MVKGEGKCANGVWCNSVLRADHRGFAGSWGRAPCRAGLSGIDGFLCASQRSVLCKGARGWRLQYRYLVRPFFSSCGSTRPSNASNRALTFWFHPLSPLSFWRCSRSLGRFPVHSREGLIFWIDFLAEAASIFDTCGIVWLVWGIAFYRLSQNSGDPIDARGFVDVAGQRAGTTNRRACSRHRPPPARLFGAPGYKFRHHQRHSDPVAPVRSERPAAIQEAYGRVHGAGCGREMMRR